MADIELVIKIPERIHYGIEKGITVNGSQASQILIDAVKNGIPLEQDKKNDLRIAYISRKSVIDELKRYFHDEYYQRTSIQDCRDSFIEDVLIHLPSVTPQEPRKGHWIDIHEYHYYNDGDIETTELKCSCCNEEVEWDIELLHKPYFCENCGADMREEKDSNV